MSSAIRLTAIVATSLVVGAGNLATTRPATPSDDLALLDVLVADWDAYGLPSPPAEAWPAVGEERERFGRPSEHTPRFFLFAVGGDSRPVQAAYSTLGWRIQASEFAFDSMKRLSGNETSLAGVFPMRPSSLEFGVYSGDWGRQWSIAWLAAAVQCHRLQSDDVATIALRLARQPSPPGHGIPPATDPLVAEPRRSLAHFAWDHWQQQYVNADTDRDRVVRSLRLLIRTPFGLDTPERRSFLARIEPRPTRAPAGSADALIDDLVNLTEDGGFFGDFNRESVDAAAFDPRYYRLMLAGFDAVPAMIAHLNDRRPTRCIRGAEAQPTDAPMEVGDVVVDILRGLACDTLPINEPTAGCWHGLDRGDAERWWETARAQGEEAYLLENVIPMGPQPPEPALEDTAPPANLRTRAEAEKFMARQRVKEQLHYRRSIAVGRNRPCHARQQLLRILAAKYPDRLGEVYERANRDCPSAPNDLLAHLVGRRAAASGGKADAMLSIAQGGSEPVRYGAIAGLLDGKHERAASLLIAALEVVPPERCAEWALLVAKTDDAGAWEKLAEVTRTKCNARQREDVLSRFSCCDGCPQRIRARLACCCEDGRRDRCIAFLRRFLEDDERVHDSAYFALYALLGLSESLDFNDQAGRESMRAAVRDELARRDAEAAPRGPGGSKP